MIDLKQNTRVVKLNIGIQEMKDGCWDQAYEIEFWAVRVILIL